MNSNFVPGCSNQNSARSSGPGMALILKGRGACRYLRVRREFLRVQKSGRRFRGKTLLLLVARGYEDQRAVGLTVSRKVGNAVVRNRVRRRLREILRSDPDLLGAGRAHVVVASPRAARAPFSVLREELKCLLSRARDSA